jgi:hypothetical protein
MDKIQAMAGRSRIPVNMISEIVRSGINVIRSNQEIPG